MRYVGVSGLTLLLQAVMVFSLCWAEPQQQGELPGISLGLPAEAKLEQFPLGPGDELKVTVWGYPELSEQVVVLPDGTMSYPLIGSLQAGGLTASQLSRAIQEALTRHIEAPQVNLVVTQMRSRHFSVMGEVGTPGRYPLWSERMTVLEAIAQAGGLGKTALPSEVRIFREGGEGESAVVNLSSLLEGGKDKTVPTLQAGDLVYVPSFATSRRVSVVGQVNTPGVYPLQPGMTVLDALSTAGWVSPSGVSDRVLVMRNSPDGRRERFAVNAHKAVTRKDAARALLLEPGDMIFVPEKLTSKFGRFMSTLTAGPEAGARTYLKVYDASNPATYNITDR